VDGKVEQDETIVQVEKAEVDVEIVRDEVLVEWWVSNERKPLLFGGE